MKKHLKIYSEKLIDAESELHFAWHKSLQDITLEHTHNFYEIFLIADGSVIHYVNGSKQLLHAGALVFIRPDDIHYYEKNKNDICEIINIAFPLTTLAKLFEYLDEGFDSNKLISSKYPPVITLPDLEKKMMIQRMESLHLISRDSAKEIKTGLRILLLEIFSRYFASRSNYYDSEVPYWIDRLREEMQKKENFIPGFKRMLEIANKSKEHLCRQFKKSYNLTPTEFINDLRLNYAANLLLSTDEAILSIALQAGFENLSHFYHRFKKKFGVSPKVFRRENKKIVIP